MGRAGEKKNRLKERRQSRHTFPRPLIILPIRLYYLISPRKDTWGEFNETHTYNATVQDLTELYNNHIKEFSSAPSQVI